ncbi:MAG: sigma-70 family RNA polymerase sigma factor [Planctomycetota bacterium]
MHEPTAIRLEDLLREQRWLSGLARSLVADANEADDVVQETARRALSGAGGPRESGLRGWLARTARHVVSERRRSERRRDWREGRRSAEEADDGLDPAEVLARAELRERLAHLVMELGEDERTAIAMRFYEGLDAATIAERTGASPAAVRQRISRGVGRLRARLDVAEGTDRRWYGVAAGIVDGGNETLLTSRGSASLVPSVVAVGLVLVTALFLWPPWSAAPATNVEVRANEDPLARDAAPVEVASVPESRSPVLTPPVEVQAEVQAEVRVVESDGETPASDVEWFVVRTGLHDQGGVMGFSNPAPPPEPIASGTTGPDGVARFAAPPDPLVHLVTRLTERSAIGSYAVRWDGEAADPATVSLDPGATLAGRCVDDTGAKLAEVVLVHESYDGTWVERGRSGADGRFEVTRITEFPRAFVVTDEDAIVPSRVDQPVLHAVRAEAWDRSHTNAWLGAGLRIERAPKGRVDVGDVVLERRRIVRGRVVDPDGAPVAGALVTTNYSIRDLVEGAGRGSRQPVLPWDEGGSVGVQEALTDESGAFRITLWRYSATLSSSRLVALRPNGDGVVAPLPRPGPGEVSEPQTLTIAPVPRTTLQLVDPEAPGGSLRWPVAADRVAALWPDLPFAGRGGGQRDVPVDERDRLNVDEGTLGGERGLVMLSVPGYAPREVEVDTAEDLVEIELERLPVLRVTVQLEGAGADDIGRVSLGVSPLPPREDEDGASKGRRISSLSMSAVSSVRFGVSVGEAVELPVPVKGPRWVYVSVYGPPPGHRLPDDVPFGPFPPEVSEVEVVLPFDGWELAARASADAGDALADSRRATLLVSVVSSATGEPVDDAWLRVRTPEYWARGHSNGDGRLEAQVPPGSFTIDVGAPGHRPMELGPVAFTRGETVDLGQLEVEPLRVLEVELRSRGGDLITERRKVRHSDPVLGERTLRSTRRGVVVLEVEDGPPATIDVGARDGQHNAYLTLPLEGDEERGLSVTVPPWRAIQIEARGLDPAWRLLFTPVMAERADGTRVQMWNGGTRDGAAVYRGVLPPGRWSVVSGPHVHVDSTPFEVPDELVDEALVVPVTAAPRHR